MSGALPSLGSQLDGAWAKVRRANEQAGRLDYSLKRFGKHDPYVLSSKPYPDQVYEPMVTDFGIAARVTPLVKQYKLIVGLRRVIPEPEVAKATLRWGIMVGEIVHNLNSALEYLVWELSGPMMAAHMPKNSAFREMQTRVGFPVVRADVNNAWNDACNRQLRFVPAHIQDALKHHQPFDRWQQSEKRPELHPFAILREVWNRDKHSAVIVNLFAANLEGTTYSFASLGEAQLPAKAIELFPIRPLEAETELGVVEVDFPVAIPTFSPVNLPVHVNGNFALHVLFGEGAAAGEPIRKWIKDAQNLTARLLALFT